MTKPQSVISMGDMASVLTQLFCVAVVSVLAVGAIAESVDSKSAVPDPIHVIDANRYEAAKNGGKATVEARYRALLATASRAETFRIFSGIVNLYCTHTPSEPADGKRSKMVADEFLELSQTVDRHRLDMLHVAAKVSSDFDPSYALGRAEEMIRTFPSQNIAKIRAYSIFGGIESRRGNAASATQFYETILDYQPKESSDVPGDRDEMAVMQSNAGNALYHLVLRDQSGPIARRNALSLLYSRYPQIASQKFGTFLEHAASLREEIEDDASEFSGETGFKYLF